MAQYKKLQNYCVNYNNANEVSNERYVERLTPAPAPAPAPTPVQQVISINNKDDLDELKNIPGHIVLVKYFATWCGPCKNFAPKYEKLANESGPDVIATEVDIDQVPSNIQGVPTTEVYVGGVKVDTITGGSIENLNKSIENVRAVHNPRNKKSTCG